MRSKVTVARSGMRSVELVGKVIVGPETAKKLGVPVGSAVDLGTLAYWHTNPIRRLLHRFKRSN